MSSIHSANTMHLPKPGYCVRIWPQSHGQYLWCGSHALLLGELCWEHLIEWAQSQPMSYWIAKDRIDGVKSR